VPSSTTTTTTILTGTITTTSTTAAVEPTGTISGWKYYGCYVDQNDLRTLTFGATTYGGGYAMTIEICIASCFDSGYKLAGLEFGAQCYCDDFLRHGVTGTAPDGEAQCISQCNGNKNEICGGSSRLSIYSASGPPSPENSAPSPTTSGISVPTAIPAAWSYKGCWVDGAYGRILAHVEQDNQALTVESCIITCSSLGYIIAGMQYGVQCFCGNTIRSGGILGAENTCNVACSGNANEVCGGGYRDSIYSNMTLVVESAPTVITAWGKWTYKGCLVANTKPVPLHAGPSNRLDNKPATCLATCQKFGYAVGGMQAGNQCYCGNADDVAATGPTFVSDAECNQACTGDGSVYCGGAGKISYYTHSTPSELFVWHYPTGNGLGSYTYFNIGPVVPLISTVGIDNKVIFMEKTGTSPTPGSTGSYELDLTTGAYRALHPKTDIFCAAGIVLPDKAGRQLVIGGWSADSTFGVRLYTPGGNNDWEENPDELRLAEGRWYPSAMIMANGSVLVVGGENGANGAATPSLELLPSGGGTRYMQWLKDTDPYNLYPYLAVLPTGNIFVSYYQQAQILDEHTFDTVRMLPVIPGSILGDINGNTGIDGNLIGGRTYPLEGTAVLMPQHYPYHDPLVIMMCGGGFPNGGPALDNCVSIRPEVVGDVWVIERMVSSTLHLI